MVARQALLKTLQSNGLLDTAVNDFRRCCGVDLLFIPEPRMPAPTRAGALFVPIALKNNTLGFLVCPRPDSPGLAESLHRMLERVATHLECSLVGLVPHEETALPASVAQAARLMQEHFCEPLSLSDVASRVGLSQERLSRLFHQTLGIPFSEYLNLLRLDHCRKLLRESNASITDIAFSSGYQSLSQFNRRFKAAEGLSPSAYRRRITALAFPESA